MDDRNRNDLHADGTENRVGGSLDELKGRANDAIGGATGDTSQQLKGKGQQLKGKVKQALGEGQQDAANRDR